MTENCSIHRIVKTASLLCSNFLYAKSSFIDAYLMRETNRQEVAVQNVADALIGFLKKCTLNDVFVVFNLSYAKQSVVKQESE